ncbi:flagellar basal body-associated protein FliL [Alteribacillus sp. JSM 102045]|uniref:flagellar basal body-associated protein FliL n=1 Tax=Alteribacillus sp. JSM 102045 TaxID=1562101 RepID=UPI0035C1E9F1
MFQNRLVNIMLIMIISITLIGVVTLVLFNYFSTPEAGAEPTIDEIIENSWGTEEITTNLDDKTFLKTQFRIHVDSAKAKDELEKRDFQVNNLIIHQLAGMNSSDIKSQEGLEELESTLRLKINDIMKEGKVIRIYTTERMIQ